MIFYPEHKKIAPAAFNAVECIVPGRTYIPDCGYAINLRILEKKPRNLRSNGTKAYSDWDKLKNKRFTVRSRTAGDRFFPFGLGALTKLKDFLRGQRVPHHMRDTIPLICAGKDIVWVVGYRTDERWKVTKKTKHILEINIEK